MRFTTSSLIFLLASSVANVGVYAIDATPLDSDAGVTEEPPPPVLETEPERLPPGQAKPVEAKKWSPEVIEKVKKEKVLIKEEKEELRKQETELKELEQAANELESEKPEDPKPEREKKPKEGTTTGVTEESPPPGDASEWSSEAIEKAKKKVLIKEEKGKIRENEKELHKLTQAAEELDAGATGGGLRG